MEPYKQANQALDDQCENFGQFQLRANSAVSSLVYLLTTHKGISNINY